MARFLVPSPLCESQFTAHFHNFAELDVPEKVGPATDIAFGVKRMIYIKGPDFLINRFSALLVALSIGLMGTPAKAIEIIKPEGVLELFTSQGCNSCPSADAVLTKLVKEGRILGLSRHVDYWDYLGWKDQFALPENTQLQYGYARTLHERQVYTPQAVINGRAHVVGSREEEIRALVKTLKESGKGITVPINVSVRTDSLAIRVDNDAVAQDATLFLVYFEKEKEIQINRGENAGRLMRYSNVVHDTQPLGMIKSGGLSVEFPMAELRKRGSGSYALLLQKSDQDGNPAAVLGAIIINDL